MKETFKIGDEVEFNYSAVRFVVTYIDPLDGKLAGIGADGIGFVDKIPGKWHKTGRFFPEAVALMDALKRGGD